MIWMIWPSQSLNGKDVPWVSFSYYGKNKPWGNIKKIFEPNIKNPHTTILTNFIGCEKSHFVLGLIERKYNKDFD